VATIVRDVNSQLRRTGDVESLGRRMIGKPAPPIRLKSLDGEAIPAAELSGKIVLLHFWSYQGDPFPPEPYGQVGFLDHLSHRRKKLGVQIYGVAIDPRFTDTAQAPAALRSVRKLQSFMNLTYPVVLDNGTLERLGDPERVGAKLPLWVLIDAKGTVVQYKVGNYVIKADEGLAQLDQAILTLVKQQRTTKAD
jgi:alkyl hydroperoxide reductase subunit AhpC